MHVPPLPGPKGVVLIRMQAEYSNFIGWLIEEMEVNHTRCEFLIIKAPNDVQN